jgi:hypothetical protein
MLVLLALQVAVVPPLSPLQDQDQGPLPATAVGVPTKQSVANDGAARIVVPFAVPHNPLVEGLAAQAPVIVSQ